MKYKAKRKYYDLEEGMIVLGYNLSKEEAIKLIHAREKRKYFLCEDEYLPAEDIEPIYKLTITITGYNDGHFQWESKPENEDDQIIGWVITC